MDETTGDRDVIAQLEEAVAHRTVIGKALGILMERFDLDDGAAFAHLVRCSSEQNRKLYDIARELVHLREIQRHPVPAGTASVNGMIPSSLGTSRDASTEKSGPARSRQEGVRRSPQA